MDREYIDQECTNCGSNKMRVQELDTDKPAHFLSGITERLQFLSCPICGDRYLLEKSLQQNGGYQIGYLYHPDKQPQLARIAQMSKDPDRTDSGVKLASWLYLVNGESVPAEPWKAELEGRRQAMKAQALN